VELLTIGAFAREARLSPKALRLYDDAGLLRPAAVDAANGYRYYDRAQLDRARLVGWLRRLDMPLRRIKEICDRPDADAARAVAEFLAETEAQQAERGRLAGFLVDYLTGKGTTMTQNPALGLRFAAGSETGKVRGTNQDIAYAGSTLLAVADGSAPDGEPAATAAIEVFKSITGDGDLLEALAAGVRDAHQAVLDRGTAVSTLTALVWSDSRIGVAHIGDSRAYLLRGGVLSRFTDDHSYVQKLVDEGKLDPADAAGHPKRPFLVRALGVAAEADISLRTAVPGDRYLLCSDGLWSEVDQGEIGSALASGDDPQATVDRLIGLAMDGEAPDNIACVVADVVPV
jgi:PPM family protein phosphatase